METESEAGFREFVEARSGALLRVALLLSGGDWAAAEDQLQNALIKAATRWQRIDEPEAYVRQVLYRQQIGRWRLGRRTREFVVAKPPERQNGDDPVGAAELRIPQDDVVARPGQSVPRELIAAGDVAVSAYHTLRPRREREGLDFYEWHLYDPAAGEYRATDWSWVSVSSVEFSPDGKRLLATDGTVNGDRMDEDRSDERASRNGAAFHVIDIASGRTDFVALPPMDDEDPTSPADSVYWDLRWTQDGKHIWQQWPTNPGRLYFDLSGEPIGTPKREKHLSPGGAGLSPDGSLIGGDSAGRGGEIASEILDARTGTRVTLVPVLQLLAWADDRRLFAWSCDPDNCSGRNEYRAGLLLVSLDGDETIPPSGFSTPGPDSDKRWEPVFTER